MCVICVTSFPTFCLLKRLGARYKFRIVYLPAPEIKFQIRWRILLCVIMVHFSWRTKGRFLGEVIAPKINHTVTLVEPPARVAFSRDKRLVVVVFVDSIASTIKPSGLLRHSICKGAPSLLPLFSNPPCSIGTGPSFPPSHPSPPSSWCFLSFLLSGPSFFRFAPREDQ